MGRRAGVPGPGARPGTHAGQNGEGRGPPACRRGSRRLARGPWDRHGRAAALARGSGQGRERGDDEGGDLLDRKVAREAGCLTMPPPPEAGRLPRRPRGPKTIEARPCVPVPSRGGSRMSAASSTPSTARSTSMSLPNRAPPHQPREVRSTRYDTTTRPPRTGRTIERAGEQLHLGERHRLVDALEDPLQVAPAVTSSAARQSDFGVVWSTETAPCRSRALRRASLRSPASEQPRDRRRHPREPRPSTTPRRPPGWPSRSAVVVMVVDIDDRRRAE